MIKITVHSFSLEFKTARTASKFLALVGDMIPSIYRALKREPFPATIYASMTDLSGDIELLTRVPLKSNDFGYAQDEENN